MYACRSAPPKGPHSKSVKHNMREKNPGRYSQTIGMILLTLILWGCGGSPQKPEGSQTAPAVAQQPPAPEDPLTLPPSQFSAQFSSAEQFLARFDWMQASDVLQGLPDDTLTSNDLTYRAYLQARIAYISGDQQGAMRQLDEQDKPDTHPALRYRLLSFRHHMLELQGDYIGAAYQADQILRLAEGDNAAAWKRNIWRNLQRAGLAQIEEALATASDLQWDAWLELAMISRGNSFALAAELARWSEINPDHPAAKPLPGGLSHLQQSGSNPGSVALMLPLSGRLAPAGKAVLDGYLAAYYTARSTGQASHELVVMDMNDYTSADTAYEEAVNLGATIAVGPLRNRGWRILPHAWTAPFLCWHSIG